MNRKFKVGAVLAGGLAVLGLAGCTSDADKVSQNIATSAEAFEIQRTIVGINGITGETTFYAEGRCSFEASGKRVDATCKHGEDDYRKHVFVLGDQDSVTITQEEGIDVSEYHTRIILKPQNIIPEFDIAMGEDE